MTKKTKNRRTGDRGERRTALYLILRGYRILERNYTFGHKEIDLICVDGDYIVFVEVKARSDTEHGLPAESVTPQKIRYLRMAAEMYLQKTGNTESFCRFDVVEVYLSDGFVRHIADAF